MALSESNYALEFLLSEAPGGLSRDEGTLLSGQSLIAGAVVGQITKAIAAAPIPTIVGTGTGLMSALTFGPDAQTGSYVIALTATSATAAFSVTAPDGTALPTGNVATAYTSSHLSFLIANGGTMTTGDVFTVVVTAGGTPISAATLQRRVNRLIDRCGIEHTFHDLRKRAATLSIARTGDVYAVAKAFGWSSIETASTYAAVSDESLDAIANAVI